MALRPFPARKTETHSRGVRPQRSGRCRRDRLRIGIIAPPWVAVPPPVYGGTELMVDVLARGLVAAGHNVTLFATGDASLVELEDSTKSRSSCQR